ncbi:hypothetical protein QCA50_010554 [Cerrena zonata]|uniref:diacylglycerol O-acyltransferase n=1 Tax=Cerrena zonata TaxID=2478898 RepID=A0AAW0G5D3_9APHY
METRRTFTSATRTLSASNLRERLSSLSSLTTTPLKPPTLPKIHANIEYYWDVRLTLIHFSPFLSSRRITNSRGAICTFATEATGFSKAFPGIVPHLLTLASNFRVPFYRDIILAMGICSVSRESCSNILKGGPGQSITIVVGGAAESLSAHPGTADLTLRKRLGFIKVAIQQGADLVPVFSFGENDIYEQMPNEKGTTVYTLQKKFQNMFGFTLPLFHGRGLLNYNLGLLPYRRRIVAVIGRPIHVEQCDKPTLDEIRRIQEQYIDELMSIWNTYKDQFARTRRRELSIVE